jgi:hypothetical protein
MQARADSDAPRLLAKFESGALVRPLAEVPTLVDLATAWWTACEVEGLASTRAAVELGERIGRADHLVCVIADGLGLDMLEAMPAASFLWQHLAGALRTVYPSTTATALTSFYTASWPSAHGITGHWLQLPPPVGAATTLSFATRFEGRPLDPRVSDEVFCAPSCFGRSPRRRLLLVPSAIAQGGFTEYVSGGAPVEGYRSLAGAFDAAARFALEDNEPSCSVLYTPRIDDAAHEHGPSHLEVVAAVRALNAQVALLATALRNRARIVLTADHGHLAVPPGARAIVRADDDLGRMLAAPPAGDARVAMLHVRPDADGAAFAAAFRARLAEQFALLTPDEVEALELLGPAPGSSATRQRLGQFVAVALGGDVLEYRVSGSRADPRLGWRSQHSGLTAAEMRIPLVIV